MDRRELAKLLGLASTGAVAGCKLLSDDRQSQTQSNRNAVNYGVASGDPAPEKIIIWTRIPNHVIKGEPAIKTTYEVATGPNFTPTTIAARGEALAFANADYTVHVEVTGLRPNAVYFYRFYTDRFASDFGKTKTAPAPDSPHPFKFAAVSCQNYVSGFYNVYANLSQSDIDFIVHLGDFIYEGGGQANRKGYVRTDAIGQGVARSLADYRLKYQLYLLDHDLKNARRLFPFIQLWDDHEVFDNYSGLSIPNSQRGRVQNARRAFLEYHPNKLMTDPAVAADASASSPQITRKFRYGESAEFFALDQRSYREPIPCGENQISSACAELLQRSMLGRSQKNWLMSGLSTSKAHWKFILNEVMFMPYRITKSGAFFDLIASIGGLSHRYRDNVYLNFDAWDGFPGERAELIGFLSDRSVPNVVFLTGDIHNFYAAEIRTNLEYAGSRVATEFTTSAISSDGILDKFGDKARMPRRFKNLSKGALNAAAIQAVKSSNEHMRQVDLMYNGCLIVSVTSHVLGIDQMGVATVKRRNQPFKLVGKMTVATGSQTIR